MPNGARVCAHNQVRDRSGSTRSRDLGATFQNHVAIFAHVAKRPVGVRAGMPRAHPFLVHAFFCKNGRWAGTTGPGTAGTATAVATFFVRWAGTARGAAVAGTTGLRGLAFLLGRRRGWRRSRLLFGLVSGRAALASLGRGNIAFQQVPVAGVQDSDGRGFDPCCVFNHPGQGAK